MLRIFAATALAAALATFVPSASFAHTRLPGEIVVLLAPGAANSLAPDAIGRARTTDVAMADVLARHGLDEAKALGPVRARGRTMLLTSKRADFDADRAVQELRALPGVRAAAPNQLLDSYLVPNDPMLPTRQWHLSTSAAAIRAQNGWDLETGDSSVVIAIIDSGVDRGHPDMAGRMWTNPDEIPNNGIDDDNNDLIDDVNGWDFANIDNDPNPENTAATTGIDSGFHGTFIAGLAGAATNNGLGIAGVDWQAKILSLKVKTVTGAIPLAAVAEAWQYALAEGADVLNLSFGGTDSTLATIFQVLANEAVDANAMPVAAAGNDGNDLGHWPAACESVLAVASTTASNTRAPTSCWGWYVDVAAPGENVWSAIPRNYAPDPSSAFFFSFVYSYDGVNPYMFNSGTSFSAPIVAGACALVRARFPAAPATAVMKHIIETADVVNYDNDIGGRLNLLAALTQVIDASSPVADAGGMLSLAAVAPNPMTARGTLALSLPHAGAVRVAVFDPRGRLVRSLFDGPLDAGPHRLTWDGTDTNGARVRPGLYFVRAQHGAASRAVRVTVLAP